MRLSLDAVRGSARLLLKHRGFSAVAVASLALAIALNTTMYSMLDALVSPRVDMRDPRQLYSVASFGDYRRRVDQETRNSLLKSGFRSYEALTSSSLTAWNAL